MDLRVSTHIRTVEIDRLAKLAVYRLDWIKRMGMARMETVAVCNRYLRLAIVLRPGQHVDITDMELLELLPYPMEFDHLIPKSAIDDSKW